MSNLCLMQTKGNCYEEHGYESQSELPGLLYDMTEGSTPPTQLKLAPLCPEEEYTSFPLMRNSVTYLISEQLSEDNIVICEKVTVLLPTTDVSRYNTCFALA